MLQEQLRIWLVMKPLHQLEQKLSKENYQENLAKKIKQKLVKKVNKRDRDLDLYLISIN